MVQKSRAKDETEVKYEAFFTMFYSIVGYTFSANVEQCLFRINNADIAMKFYYRSCMQQFNTFFKLIRVDTMEMLNVRV